MRPVVIAAGGTGGHFFPAEALGARLIARGHRVVLMTDARAAAGHSATFRGHEQHVLPGAGIAGRGLVRGLRAIALLAAGTMRARRILASIDAGVVVGFGGYPCVPPVLAARTLARRPFVVLQEQNAVLGRANRLLARWADLLALGFARTSAIPARVRTAVTGNPVRGAIADAAGQGYAPPEDGVNILVLGGSLGARVFSDVVPAALNALPPGERHRIRIVQQCRAEDIERVRTAYAACGLDAELSVFFDDVAGRLVRAHLVIARAGASTCAELAAIGRPSILVPLPGAIDDHQSANAASFAAVGAARVVRQAEFTPAALCSLLQSSLQPGWLAAAAAAASALARAGAADDLADLVEQQLARAETIH